MNTLSFLQCVLPQAPAYFLQLLVCDSQPVPVDGKSIPCYSLEHLAACVDAGTAKGYDVFVSMAGYPVSAKGHYARYAQAHRTFFLDLDCGPGKAWPDQPTALNALVTFLKLTSLPAPLIVSSGNGIHLHWPCIETFDSARWVKIASLLQGVCTQTGFHADMKVTTDCVRLLRPTGTLNRKVRNAPKPVQLLYPKQDSYQPVPYTTFLEPLVAYATKHGIGIREPAPPKQEARYDSDLAANMPGLEPYSANQIATECLAVRWFTFNGGDSVQPKVSGARPLKMSQPDWMSMARLAKFSTEGEEWFHEHGAKYSGYSRSESQGVLNRSQLRGVTCETLVTSPAARQHICGRCQHCGKISSPLHLGTPRPQPMDEIPAEELQQAAAAMPESDTMSVCPPALEKLGYSYDDKGVWKKHSDGKKYPVTNYMLEYVSKAEHNNAVHYVLVWRAPHGRRITTELPGAELGAHTLQVLAKLGAADISFTGKGDQAVSYIRDWVRSISAQSALPAVAQMGWQEDGSFVVGTDVWKDGQRMTARLVTPAAEDAPMYRTRGTLEGQLAAIHELFPKRDDFVPGQILLLGGLASVIIHDDEPISSPTVSAYSLESGHGKSVAEEAALGLWGNPAQLEMKGADASQTAIINRLAATGTLPIVLDEVTGSDPQRIFNVINLIQGNKTSDRGNNNGTNRIARNWRTVAYISTNEPLRQKLQSIDRVTDGVSMRLIEFEYRNPTVKQSVVEMSTTALFQNYGHVGRYVIERYTANRARYREMFRESLRYFRNIPGDRTDNGGERMWLRWFAAMRVVAHLCINEWKLFDFDYAAINRQLVQYLQQQRNDFRRVSPDDLTRLSDVLFAMSRNGVRLEVSRPARPGGVLMPRSGVIPNGEIICRQEDDTGLTYVHVKAFNAIAGSYAKRLVEFARTNHLCEPTVRRGMRLKAYLGAADSPVDCYIFNQRAIDREINRHNVPSAVVDTFENESASPHAAHLRTVK